MIELPKQPMLTSDVAELLGVLTDSVGGVAKFGARHGVPMPAPMRIGNANVWERAEIEAWIAALPDRRRGWPAGKQRLSS